MELKQQQKMRRIIFSDCKKQKLKIGKLKQQQFLKDQKMSNSQTTSRNSNTPSNSHSEQSDSQKESKAQNNYEYLLNELKMKSTALAKASNLIEILQVELEVEKNSKKEAIQAAEENVHRIYNMEITNLNNKIQSLETALDKKKASFVVSTEVSACQILPRQESRILRRSCSKSLNRSMSKQNFSSKQRNKNQNISLQNSLEAKMYRKMLLINSKWDNEFIQQFEQLTKMQTTDIEETVRNLEEFDIQFEDLFSINSNKKYATYARIQRLQQIVLEQNEIINEMRIYQNQLQEMIKYSSQKIMQLSQDRPWPRDKKWTENEIKQTFKQITEVLQKWKRSSKNREKKMEEENKQLREIVEEMIMLMNKKRESSTKSCGYRVS